jgi:hypothetical protein
MGQWSIAAHLGTLVASFAGRVAGCLISVGISSTRLVATQNGWVKRLSSANLRSWKWWRSSAICRATFDFWPWCHLAGTWSRTGRFSFAFAVHTFSFMVNTDVVDSTTLRTDCVLGVIHPVVTVPTIGGTTSWTSRLLLIRLHAV